MEKKLKYKINNAYLYLAKNKIEVYTIEDLRCAGGELYLSLQFEIGKTSSLCTMPGLRNLRYAQQWRAEDADSLPTCENHGASILSPIGMVGFFIQKNRLLILRMNV